MDLLSTVVSSPFFTLSVALLLAAIAVSGKFSEHAANVFLLLAWFAACLMAYQLKTNVKLTLAILLAAAAICLSVSSWIGGKKVVHNAQSAEDLTHNSPSVVLIYEDHKLVINNPGSSELMLCGTKIGDGPVSTDRPRVIPRLPYNYHLNFDEIEREVISKFGPNGEVRPRLDLYLRSEDLSRKWTAHFELWIIVRAGAIARVETQGLGVTKGWPESVQATS